MRLLLIIKLILHTLAAVAALLSCVGFGVATTKLVDSSSDSSLFGLAYGAVRPNFFFVLYSFTFPFRFPTPPSALAHEEEKENGP